MSISAQISITADNATPAVAQLMESVQPGRLARVVRDPLRAFWRDRLKHYPRLPGKFAAFPSTGFGEEAADSVEAIAGEGTVNLTAHKQGLRAQYEGAVIRPVHARCLVFGITPETYGKSYAEMRAGISWQKSKKKITLTGEVQKGRRRTRTVLAPLNKDEQANALKELNKKFAFAKQITLQRNLALVPTSDEFAEVGMAAIERSLAQN